MVRSATQFPMVLPWFNHDFFFFFFFFLQVRFLTSLFFFFFFCEISHPKISPWETLVLVQNFDRESRARSACDDRLCGEKARNGVFFLNLSGKLGMGLPGHI